MPYTLQFAGWDAHKRLVHALVRLSARETVGKLNDEGLVDVENVSEDEAPAGPCIYTGEELSAFANSLLNIMLSVFGAAEDLGAFYSKGSHRLVSKNFRILLDTALLDALWSETSSVASAEGITRVLNAMPPRDVVRLLGLLISQTFCRTYGSDASSLGPYARSVGDIAEPLQEAASFLNRGGEVSRFLRVPLVPAVTFLHRDPGRCMRIFKGEDHVVAILDGIASAVVKLRSNGEDVPIEAGDIGVLKEELLSATKALSERLAKGNNNEMREEVHPRWLYLALLCEQIS